VETAGLDAGIPHVVLGLFESADFEVVPADHEPRAASREEKEPTVDRQSEATPTASLAQPSTQNKLKDMSAARVRQWQAIHGIVFPHKPRFLPSQVSHLSATLLEARPRDGLEPGLACLPKCRGVCAGGHL
jgi:hypothetical protein